ncbi:MAG TPA: proton-conducting transporter membrane subunit [Candidatus Omnitrophota bacterium]|nr:proton-conducting transporter membrane subunit [Candidatus Omnitrophota bacterium]
MGIVVILGIPVALAAAALLIKRQRVFGMLNCAGYLAVLCASILLLRQTVLSGNVALLGNFIYLDVLSAFFILVISVVAFSVALYSVGYIRHDIAEGKLSESKARVYYALFNLFCCSMFVVPAVNNLGILWVAIEMTTLVSAFLVGFYNSKESVEAAWKYIIICSVGIIFALLGTILFAYAFSLSAGVKSLNWSAITAGAARMDATILKVAFIFVLVGYGTKAGLAPMHTWLPDAHSQAIAPISALLSGVLLKTAIYAILRFGMILIKGAGFAYFSHLMLLLGVLSLAISCGFVLVQKDLKRLLAYSSIEHVGIIAIGFGVGSPLAIAGAALHILNHAAVKSMMFFGAGSIVSVYKRHSMNTIRGVISVLPFTGIMVLLGCFALTGFPPFSLFVSEIMIIIAAFTSGSYLLAGALLAGLSIIFGAFIFHFGKMLFGNLPKGMARRAEPLSAKIAFLFLFVPVCALGPVMFFIKKDVVWIARMLFQH